MLTLENWRHNKSETSAETGKKSLTEAKKEMNLLYSLTVFLAWLKLRSIKLYVPNVLFLLLKQLCWTVNIRKKPSKILFKNNNGQKKPHLCIVSTPFLTNVTSYGRQLQSALTYVLIQLGTAERLPVNSFSCSWCHTYQTQHGTTALRHRHVQQKSVLGPDIHTKYLGVGVGTSD